MHVLTTSRLCLGWNMPLSLFKTELPCNMDEKQSELC